MPTVPVVAAVAAVAAVGVLAHGAYHRNSFVFGRVLRRVPGGRTVALTFDDGPNPEATPRVLAALREARVPATFFLLGRHVDRWPDLVREAGKDGHTLANHGYAHRKLTYKSPAYVRDDVRAGAAAVEHAAGIAPKFFRAPHGFRSPWVNPIVRAAGERVVGWSLGVWDSERPPAATIAQRVIDGVRPGSIVLLHDGDGYDPAGDRMQTALSIPLIVEGLRSRGYTFVALGNLV